MPGEVNFMIDGEWVLTIHEDGSMTTPDWLTVAEALDRFVRDAEAQGASNGGVALARCLLGYERSRLRAAGRQY